MKFPDGSAIHTPAEVSFDRVDARPGSGLSSAGFPARSCATASPAAGEHRRTPGAWSCRAALEPLDALIAKWQTEGTTIDGSGLPADQINAIDTYERLPGGALPHLVDAEVGDLKVEGAEIIGFDPNRGAYTTQYFGSDGPTAYEATLTESSEGLIWRMRSETTRFPGTFSEDRDVITGRWDLLDGKGDWRLWIEISLNRQATN
jgi:hypothetical protein